MSDAWVAQLQQMIAMELKADGQEVRQRDLRLFKVSLFFPCKRSTNQQQTDISLNPEENLQSRALQWLHEQPTNTQLNETKLLDLVFPNGPHPRKNSQLDIIVADLEGMLYSILRFYPPDCPSVLEMIEGLGDPYDMCNRKLKKGAHCAGML